MSSVEEFKQFVRSKPFLLEKVRKGETTWQKLYESYDLYGENHSDFQEFEKEPEVRNSNSKVNKDYFNSALKAFQGIDMDKISNNIQSISKMIGAFSEFTNKQENKSDSSYKRRPYRRYDD